jgi:ribosome-associated protein
LQKQKKENISLDNNNLLKNNIVEGILEKKGENIVVLNLEKVENAFVNDFIICQADSNTQVNAIADSVEKKVLDTMKVKVHHREGEHNAIWILLDYNDVLVHIFQQEYRNYYKLEELWGDAQITRIEESFNF